MNKTPSEQHNKHEDQPLPTPTTEVKSFRMHLSERKNEIIVAVIGFVITTVVFGTILFVGQEWIKKKLSSDETFVELTLKSSSVALFQDANSLEAIQVLTYELSSSDLVKNLKVIAVFNQQTEVVRYNVIYSVDCFPSAEVAQFVSLS